MEFVDAKKREVTPTAAIRLVVMLYEGAIGALEAALEAIDKDDAEERSTTIDMARDIISRLYLALDVENGGEIANNLGSLYGYMLNRLRQANLANDPRPLREIIGLLYHLHLSWSELELRICRGKSLDPAEADSPDREPRPS